MRVQITLYGEDAENFERVKEQLDRENPGSRPTNAEALRMLMDLADLGARPRR